LVRTRLMIFMKSVTQTITEATRSTARTPKAILLKFVVNGSEKKSIYISII